jgi:hypothetical protein
MNHSQLGRRRSSIPHFFEFKDGLCYDMIVSHDDLLSIEVLREQDPLPSLLHKPPRFMLMYVLYIVK